MSELDIDINSYLKRLFPLNRSLAGSCNRQSLEILKEICPLSVLEYKSGTKVYDWKVPPEWELNRGYIKAENGETIIDTRNTNLHVASFSKRVSCKISKEALQKKLHTHPKLADAIPYRTLYYKDEWAFCLSQKQLSYLNQFKGPFTVLIDSNFDHSGSMSVGELLVNGKSSEETLISTYICHPSLANDNLSGMLLTAIIANILYSKRNILNRSYRIVWVPETIGAIAYLNQNESNMKKIDHGLVVTTTSGPGNFGYKQSFNKEHFINSSIEAVLSKYCSNYEIKPFDIHGSDERQYSSQGFRINTATIFKNKYYDYEFYHTSLDDLLYVTSDNVQKALRIYESVIDRIDKDVCYLNKFPHCEVMLSKHGLYPTIGGAIIPNTNKKSDLDMILWLLFYCDGSLYLSEIAKKIDVDFYDLDLIAKRLLDKGLLVVV